MPKEKSVFNSIINRPLVLTVLIAGISFVFFSMLQFSTLDLVDPDAYFHIKFSYLMRGQWGIIKSLPWLQYTIHKDYFRDHHFLHHIIYIPFTFGNLIIGAKWGAVIFPSLAATAFFRLLTANQIKFAFVWSLLFLVSSRVFIYRMSMARVQSISLLFMILAVLFIIERRYIALSVLAFLFVWLYDGFFMLAIIGVIFFFCEWGINKERDLKLLIYLFSGILMGMVINPYFPNNITSYIFNMMRASKSPENVSVGIEWSPYTTWYLLKDSAPVFIMFISSILYGLIYGVKDKAKSISLLMISLFFFVLLCRSRRSIEYWPVFSLMFSAFALNGLFQSKKELDTITCKTISRILITIGSILLVALSTVNVVKAREMIMDEEPLDYFKGAAIWLKENTNPGDIVFNADWDDFPQLFFYNSDNYYIVGLDSNYMYKLDPELYFKWKDITRGKISNPSIDIKNLFKANFIITDNEQEEFIEKIKEDKQCQIVYQDGNCTVYRINNDLHNDGVNNNSPLIKPIKP